MTRTSRLERGYRLLLRCYPAAWRRHHGDEMISVLLEQAAAEHRARISVSSAVDLVGHGTEERLEAVLRWWPVRLREQVSAVALTVAAGLGLLMLVGEVIGARHRPPAEQIEHGGGYFVSGPFLTIGVGLYLAFMSAALLAVLGRGGLARLMALLGVAFVAWMRWWPSAGSYPAPRLLVLVLFVGLGLLAALATIRPDRRASRRMIGFGAAFVVATTVALALTKPLLGWSLGTITTSGNIGFAVLATALPFVGGAAILVAALVGGRHPGWPSAIAVAAFPVVLFCTAVSIVVQPNQATERALYPLYYLVAVAVVALVHRHARRQLPVGRRLPG